MSANPFRTSTVIAVAVIAGASLLIGLFSGTLGGLGEQGGEVRPDAGGRSAIGQRVFVELLQQRALPVLISRADTAARLGADDVLVLAEPRAGDDAALERFSALLAASRRTLVVLPRRVGASDPARPTWIAEVDELPTDELAELVARIDPDARLVRREGLGAAAWVAQGGDAGAPVAPGDPGDAGDLSDLSDPAALPLPSLAHPVQLLSAASLTPRLSLGDAGLLVGERRDGDVHLIVISDPDLIANHGLARGDNAALVLALLAELSGPDGRVVVDETLHGHHAGPSLWDELLRFPLVLLVIHLALLAVALVWSGTGRFGPPLLPTAGLRPGKQVLIDNTVDLLVAGGHHRHLLGRYRAATWRRVGAAFHIPASAGDELRRRRLAELSARRGLTLPELSEPRAATARAAAQETDTDTDHTREATARTPGGDTLAAARRVHAWQEEMLHGMG